MIDKTEAFASHEATLESQSGAGSVSGRINMRENGEVDIAIEEPVDVFFGGADQMDSVRGTDEKGRDIVLNNAKGFQPSQVASRITASSATITAGLEFTPEKVDRVVVEFDVLAFKPDYRLRNQTNHLNKIEADIGIPAINKQYIDKTDWQAYGIPLPDTTDRVEFIEETGEPVRTAKIRVVQTTHGTLEYQIEQARNRVEKILEISAFALGVIPNITREYLAELPDTPAVDTKKVHYERYRHLGGSGGGGRFKEFPPVDPKRKSAADLAKFINHAYDEYTDDVQDRLKFVEVVHYYVDALIPERSPHAKLLSICIAIEYLANRHESVDNKNFGSTKEKIEHLVNKLNVKISDVSNYTNTTVPPHTTKEYFWYRERNYVIHGEGNFTNEDIMKARSATMIVLKRALRNQLLHGNCPSGCENLYGLTPPDFQVIED